MGPEGSVEIERDRARDAAGDVAHELQLVAGHVFTEAVGDVAVGITGVDPVVDQGRELPLAAAVAAAAGTLADLDPDVLVRPPQPVNVRVDPLGRESGISSLLR